jgi:hypothetical protein
VEYENALREFEIHLLTKFRAIEQYDRILASMDHQRKVKWAFRPLNHSPITKSLPDVRGFNSYTQKRDQNPKPTPSVRVPNPL